MTHPFGLRGAMLRFHSETLCSITRLLSALALAAAIATVFGAFNEKSGELANTERLRTEIVVEARSTEPVQLAWALPSWLSPDYWFHIHVEPCHAFSLFGKCPHNLPKA
jgi:hypothetical protein